MAQDAVMQSGQEMGLAKRTVLAAFFGFFVDMFDVYLPVLVLAPAMIYFLPKNLPATMATTIYYVVFIATLVGRPIGSFIFGHYSDKIGRKRTTIVSVAGFGVLTLFMAILPGYVQWGIAAVYVLTALRFVCGIFLGGEYTAASPLALEYSPQEKRGLYGALIMTGYPVAYLLISIITSLMFLIAPLKGGAYVEWGWRVPFLVGVIIAGLFILWFNKSVPESEMWKKSAKTKEPLKLLFSGESFRNLLQVFLMMTGIWITLYMVASVLPGVLITVLKVPAPTVTHLMLFAYFVLIFGYISAGVISQRFGRRVTLMWYGAISAIVSALLYYLAIADYKNNIVGEAILIIIVILITTSVWGIVTTYINERFKTSIRSSGFGIGYSLAVVIPSFYSFYMLWLKNVMPYQYTEIVLLVIGGILIFIGAAIGPETRDVVFAPSEE